MVRALATPASPGFLTEFREHLVHPLLWGEEKAFVKPLVSRGVERLEPQREVEAACVDEFAKRLEAGGYLVALPARDLRAVPSASGAELSLGEPRSEACFTNECTARHE
jgi:hypothetical protein